MSAVASGRARRVSGLLAGFVALVAILAAPAKVAAHPGPGLLVAPDGTVYFTMYGPFPLMMLRPGGEVELAVPGVGPTWLHHLAWLPDGRIAAANDRGEVFAVTPGVGFERYLSAEALARIAEAEPPEGLAGPIPEAGGGGDPFTVDEAGAIYTVIDTYGRPRILRVDPDGSMTVLAGGGDDGVDGFGDLAGFGELHTSGMAPDGEGGVYVLDGGRLRHVTPDGAVNTLTTLDGWLTGVTVDDDVPYVTVRVVEGPDGIARLGFGGSYEVVMFDDRLDQIYGVAFGPDSAMYLKDQPHTESRIWRWTESDGLELLGVSSETAWIAELYPDADMSPPDDESDRYRGWWLIGVFAVAAIVGLAVRRRGRTSPSPTG